jgi:3',5'-cyclic AMP phosphodiesterase CpdA
MRRIIQISDLHFGRIDYAVIEKLRAIIVTLAPHLLVVSGDLTQRARSVEFIEARAFLDTLPKPQIVVPGNHDVPMYNILARFATPLEKYKKYITDDLQPFVSDEEMAFVGINTARSFTVKGGKINSEQLATVRERLCGLGDEVLKAVVTHHPFDVPEGYDEGDIVGRAKRAMRQLAECGADLFLAGHIHIGHTSETAKRYNVGAGRPALIVQAGTATSTRGRGQTNSFNIIEFDHPQLKIIRMDWIPEREVFEPAETKEYFQTDKGWKRGEHQII